MSSHEEPYPGSDESQRYYAGGAGPSAPRPSSWPVHWTQQGQSWPSQFDDPVGTQLQVHDAEDIQYTLDYNDYTAPAASSGRDFTHIYDNAPCNPYAELPFHYDSHPDYGPLPHHQTLNNYYGTTYPTPQQTSAQQPGCSIQDSLVGLPLQGSFTFQGSSSSMLADPYPSPLSTQLSSVHRRFSFGSDAGSTRSSPGGSSLRSVSTGTMALFNAEAGQPSHSPPVTTDPVSGTSRPMPSTPERKRTLPDDSDSMGRRVVARHDQASVAPDLHRRSRSGSNTDVPGRGPRIRQQRYTASGSQPFTPADGRQDPVTFNLENPSETGIPIIDILDVTDNFRRLQDRRGALGGVGGTGKQTFTLRVLWPGYEPFSKTLSTKNWAKQRSPITRGKLAEFVATAIRYLFKKNRNEAYNRDYAPWNVGPNGIQLKDIVLVAVHHVSKGSWQPELCLLHPRR
ncbi:hypothetical protein PAXINDRAFT_11986 [Paxillus involutus ATCC 200175]|uniref:Uncharacterized protein n=1 Tax=Paxillus involutus ATCC 200175 TaxID=664439 RepID=A0A0C9U7F1_PAXIN|nr:hypothetical protein PAXINDRAFT_11986 [Paxillus involutus ATCC 200175]